MILSQYDDAIADLLRYIDLAKQGLPPADLPVIYGYLGVAYARVGSWQRAIDAAQIGLDLTNAGLPGSTHVVARMQLAFIYAELHEWQQALSIAEPVRLLWEQEGMSPHFSCCAQWLDGRWFTQAASRPGWQKSMLPIDGPRKLTTEYSLICHGCSWVHAIRRQATQEEP